MLDASDYALYSLLGGRCSRRWSWLINLGIEPAVMRHPDGLHAELPLDGLVDQRGPLGIPRGSATAALAWPLSRFYAEPRVFGLILAKAALLPLIGALRSPADAPPAGRDAGLWIAFT